MLFKPFFRLIALVLGGNLVLFSMMPTLAYADQSYCSSVGYKTDLSIRDIRNRYSGRDEALPSHVYYPENLVMEIIVGAGSCNGASNVEVDVYDNGYFVSRVSVGSILSNGSASNSNLLIWNGTQGSHNLHFIVDPENKVAEYDESNNDYYSYVTVHNVYGGSFDFVTLSLDSDNLHYAKVGDKVKFKSQIRLDGNVYSTGPFIVLWYVDDTIAATQIYTINDITTQNIYPTFDWYATQGDHTVRVYVDSDNNISEASESNNQISRSFNIWGYSTPIYPDIYIKEITYNSSDQSFYMTYCNQGLSVANHYTARYRLLVDKREMGGTTVSLPGNGSCYQRYLGNRQSLQLQNASSSFIEVFINSDNRLIESNGSNNWKGQNFAFTAAPTSPTNNNTLEVVDREQRLFNYTDRNLVNRLKGRIVLQVEGNGEAWYVDPVTGKKYYLANGQEAYKALRYFGLGATNESLKKIAIGIYPTLTRNDDDGDGIDNKIENAVGTSPYLWDTDGDGYHDGNEIEFAFDPLSYARQRVGSDQNFINKLHGRILLQVEKRGEAWYVNPVNNRRYYLADGEAAYEVMRQASIGITNADLRKIPVGELPW